MSTFSILHNKWVKKNGVEPTEFAKVRDLLVEKMRLEMFGPTIRDKAQYMNEIKDIKNSPSSQYSCGILFPQRLNETDENKDADDFDLEDPRDFSEVEINSANQEKLKNKGSNNEDEDIHDDLNLSNQFKPSAISLSFRVSKADSVYVRFFFGIYEKIKVSSEGNEETKEVYKRIQKRRYLKIDLTSETEQFFRQSLFKFDGQDALEATVKIRKLSEAGRTITISMVNCLQHQDDNTEDKPTTFEMLFFQPEINVRRPLNGTFLPVEKYDFAGSDKESQKLAVRYSKVQSYSRGHGCSGDWLQSGQDDKFVTRVFSDCFPSYEVPGTAPRSVGENGYKTLFSDFSKIHEDIQTSRPKILSNLKLLADDYREWIYKQNNNTSLFEGKLNEAANDIVNECNQALQRIEEGIKFLEIDDDAYRAFVLANQAIWMQQCHFRLEPRSLGQEFNDPSNNLNKYSEYGWRPFQLAFLLMNVSSIPTSQNPSPVNGDIVDLIWFPTGGGKTEAYLGLSAFSIVYSRLKNEPGFEGTEVIMRYTLRLLTSQQFQRASTLVMALENIRSSFDLSAIGAEKFSQSSAISIGLWVGETLTPNKNNVDDKSAVKRRKQITDDGNPFQLLVCPWCKTDLENPFGNKDEFGNEKPTYDGYQIVGKGRASEVVFKCPEDKCSFGHKELPVYVVDDQLYEKTPTVLIGTVDKFAQLAWKNEPSKFFGISASKRPPSLIIQDELHLISGPLGSVVGHYEYLVREITKKIGFSPKIVASTATIRNANEQVKSLFRSGANVFPPTGLEQSDNYFSIADTLGRGRLYVGIFASSTPSVVTAERNLVAPLLQFPNLLFDEEKFTEDLGINEDTSAKRYKLKDNSYRKDVDPFGTLVWYFNSLRELGYAKTLIVSDIAEYIPNIRRRYKFPIHLSRSRYTEAELTSRVSEVDISKIEKQLKSPWSPRPDFKNLEQTAIPIDILLATNMISVGVDIPRLGLMVINGQPKNTAEYIQASSRVGREFKGSGLVFTLYNHARSRDRSHFENFISYHQSLYKNVEPTSLTPLSYKSRERCLPALIVGLARLLAGVDKPTDLNEEKKGKIYEFLNDYLEDVPSEDRDDTMNEIENIFNVWEDFIARDDFDEDDIEWGSMGGRVGEKSLLMTYGSYLDETDFPRLELLTSMRSVDGESSCKVNRGYIPTLGD